MKKLLTVSLCAIGIAQASQGPNDISVADKDSIIQAMQEGSCDKLQAFPQNLKIWLRKVTHFTYSPAPHSREAAIQNIFYQGMVSGNPIVSCVQNLLGQPQNKSQQQPESTQPSAVSDEELLTMIQKKIKNPQNLCQTLKNRASQEQIDKISKFTGMNQIPQNETEQKTSNVLMRNFMDSSQLYNCLNRVNQKAAFGW